MKKIFLMISLITLAISQPVFAFDFGGLLKEETQPVATQKPQSTTEVLTDLLKSQAGENPAVADVLDAKKQMDCFNMASTLVSEGGAATMGLFTQATSPTPPTNPNDGGLLSKVLAYVQNGCAEDHLDKALSAASMLSE